MLVIVNKLRRVPYASQITTWKTIFTKIFFGVFNERVRPWPPAFLITNLKMLAKKLLGGRTEKATIEKKKINKKN